MCLDELTHRGLLSLRYRLMGVSGEQLLLLTVLSSPARGLMMVLVLELKSDTQACCGACKEQQDKGSAHREVRSL